MINYLLLFLQKVYSQKYDIKFSSSDAQLAKKYNQKKKIRKESLMFRLQN